MVAPGEIFDVPADLTDEEAVMIEPTACAVHAVRRLGAMPAERVAVIGAGTIGLCVVAAQGLDAGEQPHHFRMIGGQSERRDDEPIRIGQTSGIERLAGGHDALDR